jgi:HD-GYP domain-containing protein (c-di-GMP phosphodiesterase class II)
MNIAVFSMAGYMSRDLSVMAMNYGRKVTAYDARLMQDLTTEGMILKTLSHRIMDSEDALAHLVRSFVKVSEPYEQDSRVHFARIGEYAGLIAQQLGMAEKFVSAIRLQSQLHDIGNLHVPSAILQKPDKLTDSEFSEVKNHTLYGAQILGEHKGFRMARNIALTHHERWDGSGYPYGMKESTIPIEGRIMNVADQYDSLRSRKAFRSPFDHDTACRIIVDGDGRTMPHHFDPQVLGAFRTAMPHLQEISEKIQL